MDSQDKFSFKLSDFSELNNGQPWKNEEQPKEPFADLDPTIFETTSELPPDLNSTSYDSLSRGSDTAAILSSIQFIVPKRSEALSDLSGSTKEEISHSQLVQLSQNQQGATGQPNSGGEAAWRAEQSMTDQLNSIDCFDRPDLTNQLNATLSEGLGPMRSCSIDSQTLSNRLIGLPIELKAKLTIKLTIYSMLFGFVEIDGQFREQVLEESLDLLDSIMATRLLKVHDGQTAIFELDYTLKEALVLNLVKNHQFLRNFEMLTSDAKASLAAENNDLLDLLNDLPIKQG